MEGCSIVFVFDVMEGQEYENFFIIVKVWTKQVKILSCFYFRTGLDCILEMVFCLLFFFVYIMYTLFLFNNILIYLSKKKKKFIFTMNIGKFSFESFDCWQCKWWWLMKKKLFNVLVVFYKGIYIYIYMCVCVCVLWIMW